MIASEEIDNKATELSVCHIVPSINELIGGPAYSVTSLASALANEGLKVELISLDYPELGPMLKAPGVKCHSIKVSSLGRHFRGYSPALKELILNRAKEVDIIHNHGLWMWPNLYARQAAQAADIPLVISPRGMLEEWSLKHARLKKFLAWHLYEKANLKAAKAFHCTASSEQKALDNLGFTQTKVIVPNGVDAEEFATPVARSILEDNFPEFRDKRLCLFMSRLHPKKGLKELINCWSALKSEIQKEWQLVIAGPDLSGYRTKLEALVQDKGLADFISFTGPLSGPQKLSALQHAELFVLPTHSENFGVVVAEALASGTAVITTKAAPWDLLNSNGCGWWIEDSEEALLATLQKALLKETNELSLMGLRGQEVATRVFDWNKIAESTIKYYNLVSS